MNKLYLNEHKDTSVVGRTIREWNSGSTLSQAVQRMESWYAMPRAEIIKVWRELWRQYGCKSVPFRPRAETNTDPAYLAWKGITGPGKQLRDILVSQ